MHPVPLGTGCQLNSQGMKYLTPAARAASMRRLWKGTSAGAIVEIMMSW